MEPVSSIFKEAFQREKDEGLCAWILRAYFLCIGATVIAGGVVMIMALPFLLIATLVAHFMGAN